MFCPEVGFASGFRVPGFHDFRGSDFEGGMP